MDMSPVLTRRKGMSEWAWGGQTAKVDTIYSLCMLPFSKLGSYALNDCMHTKLNSGYGPQDWEQLVFHDERFRTLWGVFVRGIYFILIARLRRVIQSTQLFSSVFSVPVSRPSSCQSRRHLKFWHAYLHEHRRHLQRYWKSGRLRKTGDLKEALP